MSDLKVKTFADLISRGNGSIACLYTGNVVRQLTLQDNGIVHVVAGDGTSFDIPSDTPILYQPWVMDRGNLLFEIPEVYGQLKICGEADILTTEDGERYSIVPGE